MDMTNPPNFVEEVLEGDRSSGYWVELIDVTGNESPDVIAFGVGGGEIALFENPYTKPHEGAYDLPWRRHVIDNVKRPVAMDHRPVTGSYNDFVVAVDFGQGPYAIDDSGGSIYLYRNPLNSGGVIGDNWDKVFVGRVAGTHRVRFGHFTRKDRLQVLALPIAGRDGDPFSVIPVTLFTAPEHPHETSDWELTVIDDEHIRVAHDLAIDKFEGDENELDSAVIASLEGITWLYYDGSSWKTEVLGSGLPRKLSKAQPIDGDGDAFWGCQNIAFGKVGGDKSAYISVSGPFHGNVVMLYVKFGGSPNTLRNASWKEHYVHNFDAMVPIVDGSGPVHQVATADLDNDGDDEVLIASKTTGVYYVKAKDVAKGLLQLTTVSLAPALRIAIADVDGNGMLDFASLGDVIDTESRHVPSKLNVYHNCAK